MNTTYTTPFRVVDGIIRDADSRKVKLWGVNYYMPFNHNYYNARELGRDHFAAVDEDIRHFRLLGVDLVRMHMYEREITAHDGRLVENHNMEVFDYLVEQCARNGIYLMLSPISYWNTVKNQITLDRQYGYWNVWSDEAFGFTNFYSVDALLWHPEAVRCQERYIGDLFARANKFSGKRLNEYDNIVAWELMNEIVYPVEIIESLSRPEPEIGPHNMSQAAVSRGRMRREFAEIWDAFKTAHPEFGGDEAACAAAFQEQVLGDYFRRFWGMVDDYFGGRVVKAQFMSYSGVVGGALRKFVDDNPRLIDACSIGTYLNVGCFDSESTDHADHLAVARSWFEHYAGGGRVPGLATVSYEFDATGSNCGYPLAAIGAMYGRYDVQLAAYFTYTPAAVERVEPRLARPLHEHRAHPGQGRGLRRRGRHLPPHGLCHGNLDGARRVARRRLRHRARTRPRLLQGLRHIPLFRRQRPRPRRHLESRHRQRPRPLPLRRVRRQLRVLPAKDWRRRMASHALPAPEIPLRAGARQELPLHGQPLRQLPQGAARLPALRTPRALPPQRPRHHRVPRRRRCGNPRRPRR